MEFTGDKVVTHVLRDFGFIVIVGESGYPFKNMPHDMIFVFPSPMQKILDTRQIWAQTTIFDNTIQIYFSPFVLYRYFMLLFPSQNISKMLLQLLRVEHTA